MTDGWEVSRDVLASITHWKLLILKTRANLLSLLFFFSSWFYTFPSLCFFLSFWLTNTSSISSCLFISFCHRSLTYEFTCSSRIFSSSEMLGSSHQTKLHQSGSCSWTAEPWVVSCKKEQPGSGQSPCLFWCWCELTASGNLHCWKLLTQILHICLCTLL